MRDGNRTCHSENPNTTRRLFSQDLTGCVCPRHATGHGHHQPSTAVFPRPESQYSTHREQTRDPFASVSAIEPDHPTYADGRCSLERR